MMAKIPCNIYRKKDRKNVTLQAKLKTMEDVLIKIFGYLYFGIILIVGAIGIPACLILFVVQIFRCITGKGEIKENYTITFKGHYRNKEKKKKT